MIIKTIQFITIFICLIFISSLLIAKEQGKFFGAKSIEQMPAWFKESFLDISDDLNEASAQARHVIVYFHQDGCPYCAKLVEDNFQNPALVKKLRARFDVVEMNMWGDREITDWQGQTMSEKGFASKMKIQFTPTLLFLSDKGEVILRLNGYQSSSKMHDILDYITSKSYQKQNFAQYKNNNYKEPAQKVQTPFNFEMPSYFDKPPFILSRSEIFLAPRLLGIIFTKKNCTDCKYFYQNLIKNPKIEKRLKQMQIVSLEISPAQKIITPNGKRTTADKWYESLKLTDIPALVIFNEAGREIIRKDAYLKTFHFESILDYALSDAYKSESSFQRFIEHKAEKLRARGIDVDIWK